MFKTPKTPDVSATFHTASGDECGVADALVMSMRLTFSNGERLALNDSEVYAVRIAAQWHGLKQKLVDAAAISRNPETGRTASIEDKFQAVKGVYDRLLAGEWHKARDGVPTGGLLLSALVRMYEWKKTRDELVAYLGGKTPAEQAALRKTPRVAAVIEEIRAERVKADGIDGASILGELDD